MKPSTAKAKGTATETTFVNYLQVIWGLWNVERRRLKGSADEGDIAGWPGVCVEVKSGARLDIAGWLSELAVEVENAHARTGFVAVRPKGHPNPTDWFAVLPLPVLLELMRGAGWMP